MKHFQNYFAVLFFVIIFLVLQACESESVAPNSNNDNTNQDNTTFQTEMLNAVNQLRAEGCTCGSTVMPPVAALNWDNMLENAASIHANDMEQNNNNSHTGTDGSSAGQRVTAAGYNWTRVGENIAWGQSSISQVINAWKNSEGHCKNMMNVNFADFGAAQKGTKWVQVFAKK